MNSIPIKCTEILLVHFLNLLLIFCNLGLVIYLAFTRIYCFSWQDSIRCQVYTYFYHITGNYLNAGELLVEWVNSYACVVFFKVGFMGLKTPDFLRDLWTFDAIYVLIFWLVFVFDKYMYITYIFFLGDENNHLAYY